MFFGGNLVVPFKRPVKGRLFGFTFFNNGCGGQGTMFVVNTIKLMPYRICVQIGNAPACLVKIFLH
jgi:hypothetical protein